MVIRNAVPGDAEAIATIYNHYITATHITFETEPVAAGIIASRIGETLDAGLPWLVADEGGQPAGYAYASKWKGRCAYRYSVESTIYLEPAATGRGVGRQLYQALIDAVRRCNMHVVIGGISLPNTASIGLHEALGFEAVGAFREVGYKFDRWIDVGYWQLTL
jgi:L-amino acid N-acyltransferase YncA